MKSKDKKIEEYYKSISGTPRNYGKNGSEKNNEIRKNKAIEQVKLDPIPIDEIKEMILSFLENLGAKPGFILESKSNFIWLKFTKDGYLGVVAAGCDFNYLDSNRSGTYIKFVGKVWDYTKLLVFPISTLPEGRKIKDVERAVGNYLIDKKVPIIDYYSHNY